MSFPAYPDYKDSGVAWLGAVPGHWEVAALKRQVRLVTQRADQRTFPVALENIEGWTGRFLATDTEFEGDGVAFEAGDILYGKLRPYLAKILVPNSAGEAIGDFHVLRPLEQNPYYLSYLLRTKELVSVVDGSTYGSKMPRASWDFLGSLTAAFPPIAEQTAIATFLDRETAKIDALVAEQERLITLLKEKRQAVISHAVTKGLNPNAPMKDSGIEWLGEIPAHWIVSKLFYGAKLQSGYAFASADFGSDGVPVVRMNNLSRGKLDLSEAVRIPESALMPAVALSQGDLVWGMSGSVGETGSLGNFAIVSAEDLPCQLNQRVGRFVVNTSRMTAEFLKTWIQSYPFYQQILLAVTGTAQYNVSAEQVQSTMIGFPPIEEQRRISEHVASVVDSFEELLAEAQSAITLLQERRAALISAAVTGKIDVRGLVTPSNELEVA